MQEQLPCFHFHFHVQVSTARLGKKKTPAVAAGMHLLALLGLLGLAGRAQLALPLAGGASTSAAPLRAGGASAPVGAACSPPSAISSCWRGWHCSSAGGASPSPAPVGARGASAFAGAAGVGGITVASGCAVGWGPSGRGAGSRLRMGRVFLRCIAALTTCGASNLLKWSKPPCYIRGPAAVHVISSL